MDIKMIALDMDGTLLNSDSKISVRNLDILIKLQEKGIRVVLASGRNYHKLEDYGKQLKMDRFDGYYIEVNGMAIKPAFNSERRIIERLKLADAKRIYKFIEKQSIEFQFLMDMHVYIRIPESMLQRKIDYRIENNIASNVPWRASTVAPTLNINSGYPVTIYVKDDDILKEDLNKVCLAGN
ncbi:MAG: HAD family hydrolase, partial [Erysipelotrichaceae bacterium]